MPLSLRATAVALLLLLAGLGAVCASAVGAAAPAAGAATPSARLTVGLDAGARLGGTSALHARLRIDPRRHRAPLTGLRLLYPESVGITTSGLALASRRAAVDFRLVAIEGLGLDGCPANSVLALGSARARVRIGTYHFPAVARVTLLAGLYADAALGLVAFIDGINPLGFRLAYRGAVTSAPSPFGGQLAIVLPTIPDLPDDSDFALTDLQLTVGDSRIRYRDGARAYAPAASACWAAARPAGCRSERCSPSATAARRRSRRAPPARAADRRSAGLDGGAEALAAGDEVAVEVVARRRRR